MSERLDLDLDGTLAPPRTNGELQFDAPWQPRAFGVATVLGSEDAALWTAFQEHLAAEMENVEAGEPEGYYRRWLAALESLLIGEGLLTLEEIETRSAAYVEERHDHPHNSNGR